MRLWLFQIISTCRSDQKVYACYTTFVGVLAA